jgi:hypothetical protein
LNPAAEIRPGAVFYLPFEALFGQAGTAYDKYAVVARLDPDLLMLMICTAIPPFARRNERLKRSYISIDVEDHPFLKYDSWIDCNDAKGEYTIEKLTEAYQQNSDCLVGELSDSVLKKIIGGVQTSVKLERKRKATIESALSRVLNERRLRD